MCLHSLSTAEQKYFDSNGATQPTEPGSVPATPSVPQTTETASPARSAAAEPKTVPLAARHAERERRKELQRQIEDVNRRADERFNLIAQKLAAAGSQPQPAKREIPDPEKDAVGAIRMTAEEVKVLSDFKRQIEAQAAQSQAVQAVMGQASRLESEFEKDHPDFATASAFLRDSR